MTPYTTPSQLPCAVVPEFCENQAEKSESAAKGLKGLGQAGPGSQGAGPVVGQESVGQQNMALPSSAARCCSARVQAIRIHRPCGSREV
eukprot:365906-Chlamydomonas_euryale.AAC.11